MENSNLPNRVKKILDEWHKGGVQTEECIKCSSGCCSHGGYAILENVLKIYEIYKNSELHREDYEFTKGLSLSDFVRKYFDVLCYPVGGRFIKRPILFFHMKSLTDDNQLISIPNIGSYWEIRYSLFEQNPWLNKGCVFLNKKVPNWPEDDQDASRECILHNPDSKTQITEKPIDCVFFTCIKPMKCKDVTVKISNKWHKALAVSFPKSVKRYQALVNPEVSSEV